MGINESILMNWFQKYIIHRVFEIICVLAQKLDIWKFIFQILAFSNKKHIFINENTTYHIFWESAYHDSRFDNHIDIFSDNTIFGL